MLRCSTAFSRLLSRVILMVMLATVLSPDFGWALVEGSQPHDDAATLRLIEAEAALPQADCHAHEAVDAAGGADAAHHCCPGHVLGHLLGGVAETGPLLLATGDARPLERDAGAFSSRIPDGLERPPRAAA
jgi:hypothetical protein